MRVFSKLKGINVVSIDPDKAKLLFQKGINVYYCTQIYSSNICPICVAQVVENRDLVNSNYLFFTDYSKK